MAPALAECCDLASRDPTILASLLDARFLAGSSSLAGMLEVALQRMTSAGWAEACASSMVNELSKPGLCSGDEDEPDVKRSRGGLRDVQQLLWLARLRHGRVPGGEVDKPAASGVEVPRVLVAARRFLWQVRCHLHLLDGHAQDRLRGAVQPSVATRLGFGRGADGAKALMEHYRGRTQSVCAMSQLR
jgi:[protein-PII] uridylyltransferase